MAKKCNINKEGPCISSNSPFPNNKNVRAGSGPIRYSWEPIKGDKKSKPTSKLDGCDEINGYDNIVQYVFEVILTTEGYGNHLAYVDCDYVF